MGILLMGEETWFGLGWTGKRGRTQARSVLGAGDVCRDVHVECRVYELQSLSLTEEVFSLCFDRSRGGKAIVKFIG